MQIRQLSIKGFKSLSSLIMEDVSPLIVMAGPNGAGKSNLIDALVFLGAVVKRGAKQAIREFGGFSQIHCFKHYTVNRTTIEFALKMRLQARDYDYRLTLNNIDHTPQLVEHLKVDGEVMIERSSGGSAHVRLDSSGELRALDNYAPDMTALMLLSQLPVYDYLTNIRVFRIDPAAAKEPDTSDTDATELHSHGRNVATMLSVLEKDEHFRQQVLEWIGLIVPGMERVATEHQRRDGSTVITFKEEGTKTLFPARLVSDGTMYALCILTAVLSRSRELGMTLIEEPERGLHPQAIGELIQLMRENAEAEHPIFLTTHSESVVRNTQPQELWLVAKEQGKTQLRPVREAADLLDSIPLDKAWLTNLLDGGLPW
ncbi:Predicted ATPase [Ectothiorhodospira magna]|uniref:Predicted ATPase n=1 Tax=Ectothiorhodospira magna TaxID=867345 RepID=A0A1H9E6X4_9GAMM|nr:AAA family ATPase [Ectothiorhodospira magna]SEQ21470.1 Predicted ATPase [Ectothiorhodospira magna]